MKKFSIDEYISSKMIILDGLIHRCYESVQRSLNLSTPLVSGEKLSWTQKRTDADFLGKFVCLVWGGFVCLHFIALWNSLGIASLGLLGKWYTVTTVAVASATSGNTQSIKLGYILNVLNFCNLIKKPHSTIIKCFYKFYPQSVPTLECSNVSLKVCIWKKHPSKELNQNTPESQLLWVQVFSGAISSLPPSGVLFRQNLSISLRFMDTESTVPHIMWIVCACTVNPKQLLKPLDHWIKAVEPTDLGSFKSSLNCKVIIRIFCCYYYYYYY